MVDFFSTKAIALGIQNIIENAREEIFLVSPYIKADRQITQRLAYQANSNPEVRISVIYGKKEQPEVWDWLKDLPSVEVLFSPNLHAKCYLNEQVALVTSMNLYDFSEANNDEMGLLVSARDERGLYNKILSDVRRIAVNSEVRRAAKPKPAPAGRTRPAPQPAPSKPAATSGIPKVGFCIRDKEAVPANPIKPYCERCYRSWNRYKDPEYEEKHCHICGKENDSTMVKPLCLHCYRKHKDDFEFAL